jgi:hypothetical protein
MTDLPERARKLAINLTGFDPSAYKEGSKIRRDTEARLDFAAALILAELQAVDNERLKVTEAFQLFSEKVDERLQAERERAIEETVAAFDNAKCLVAGQEEQCPNTRIPCPVCVRNKVLDALKERRDAPKR